MSRPNVGTDGSPVPKRIGTGEPTVSTTEPRRCTPRFAAASLIVVTASAFGLWWYVSPWRWTRQAEAILARDPTQADSLAEAALNDGTNAASRAWLVRCRAQLALRHPLEALGAFAQIKHPEQCDVVAWCALIEEAQAAEHTLLADMAMKTALRFRNERARVLTLVLPAKAGLLPEPEVAELVQELRGLASQHPAAWRAIGLTEQSRGRLAEAVEAYRQVLALSDVSQPIGLASRRELAQLLIDLGQFSAAEPLVAEVLLLVPALSEDQLRLAQLRRSMSDRAGAEKLLNELLTKEPENLPARLQRGALFVELQQLDAAQADFEHCLRIAPFHDEAHYRLSQTLLRQGDTLGAAKHLREHRRVSKLKLQVFEINQQRTVAPQDPKLMDNMADLYEALGQPSRSAEWRRLAQSARKLNNP